MRRPRMRCAAARRPLKDRSASASHARRSWTTRKCARAAHAGARDGPSVGASIHRHTGEPRMSTDRRTSQAVGPDQGHPLRHADPPPRRRPAAQPSADHAEQAARRGRDAVLLRPEGRRDRAPRRARRQRQRRLRQHRRRQLRLDLRARPRCSEDPAQKEELFNTMAKAWFPERRRPTRTWACWRCASSTPSTGTSRTAR